jgi:hypothetical protein
VDVANALRAQLLGPRLRGFGQRGRVIDHDRLACQRRSDLLEDRIDDCVVRQHQVHALGTGRCLLRRDGDGRAQRGERARFAFGAVPHRHRRARPQKTLDHP